MPQLIIKGMALPDVKTISRALTEELAEIIGCPRDYFILEVPAGIFVFDGQEVSITPLIEVKWFDRGQEIQDRTASALCRHIRSAGYEQVEIFFTVLDPPRYYENETHY